MSKVSPGEAAKIKAAKRRKRDIITVAVLILLIPVVILGIQFYKKQSEIQAVKSQIRSIYTGAKLFTHDRNYQPSGVSELEELDLVVFNDDLRRKWRFNLNWPQTIEGISINMTSGGKEKKITFNIPEERFYGYGCPLEGDPL